MASLLSTAASRASAASLILAASAGLAMAEFEIQESTIDPGEIQLQYRGAWHSGLPKGSSIEQVLPDDEEAPLRQGHEFEVQVSLTGHWLVAVTHGFDQPDGDDFRLSAIEAETQFEFITREGDGLGFAIQGGTEQPVFDARDEQGSRNTYRSDCRTGREEGSADAHPLFFKELGNLSEQEGIGFEYGWQARYEATERLSLALEMFGEIEDMANAGSFNEQLHSIGPAFYYTFGKDDEGGNGNGEPPTPELTVSLGGQFGLTGANSDFALKVFVGYEFTPRLLR
ncbi:MAG: hypothetical protein ACR2J1_00655 [Methyloceanibacter sp.]|uniref:hypothetical protein n=1 Tax=Methyloceanibacter sp. TaxID=1965321 RepID=UPI003D9B9FE5